MSRSALEKYQFKPFLGSSHDWALGKVESFQTHIDVLDIGCGSSAIGKVLRERGFQSLHAVEIDEEAFNNALGVYNRVGRDLSDISDRSYDLILLLDVIEHMHNPEEYLQNVIELLSPEGILLISVPNVAHWSVRFPLLLGYFNYTDRAILDKTHLQFFTKRRFTKLLNAQKNSVVKEVAASIEPIEFLLPKIIWDNSIFSFCSRTRIFLANLMPGLLGYQHLAIVKKSE